MLEVRNVTKVYNSGRNAFKALDDVNINFGSRGLVVVLGKSGCGKSTLLNIIGGLDSPTSGEVVINGRSTKSFKRSDFDAYRNTFVGIVFQEFNLIDEISVFDNINMTMKLQEKSADVNTVDEALAMVGLANLGYRKPSELSGGQRQRVALARALLKKPEIILADEPTGALDSVTSEEVFETLKRIAQTKLVIVVTHNRELALSYADRIVEIVDGKIVGDRTRASSVDDGVKELEAGIIEVGAGGKVTAEQLNSRLKKGKVNYIGLSHEKDRIALAYPETVDGFYEAQDSAEYKKTEEKDIKTDNKEFRLSKGGLRFKDSIKLAREGIKRSKKRYRFLMFIMSVCFTMFSLALIVGTVSLPSVTAKSAFDTGAQPLVVVGAVNSDFRREKMTDEKIAEATSIMGGDSAGATLVYTTPVLGESNSYTLSDNDGQYGADRRFWYGESNPFALTCFNNVMDCDDITGLGLEVVAGTGSCKSLDEIIISDYAAYVMTRRGIVGYDATGEFGLHYLEEVKDVVGCRIELSETGKFYKVAGLFKTDYERYKSTIGASEYDMEAADLKPVLTGNRSFLYLTLIGKTGLGSQIKADKSKGGNSYSGNYNFELIAPSSEYGSYMSFNMSKLHYDKESFKENLLWSKQGANHDEAPDALADNEIIIGYEALRSIMQVWDLNRPEEILQHSGFQNAINTTYTLKMTRNYSVSVGAEDGYQVKIAGLTGWSGYDNDLMVSDNILAEVNSSDDAYDIAYFAKGMSRNALDSKFSSLKKAGFAFGTAAANFEDMLFFDETLSVMGQVFFYIALAMLVLAFLITFNYMTASIRFRTKEIAVYRVIGAKTFDVSKMFLCEGGFIVVITSVIAIIASFLLSLLLNSIMGDALMVFGMSTTLINFNWLIEPIVIVLGSAVTVFLSAIIPIMRVCGKKPVEAVKMI